MTVTGMSASFGAVYIALFYGGVFGASDGRRQKCGYATSMVRGTHGWWCYPLGGWWNAPARCLLGAAYCMDRQYKGVLSGYAVHGCTVWIGSTCAFCLDRQYMGVLSG